jgi:hypothetical protein
MNGVDDLIGVIINIALTIFPPFNGGYEWKGFSAFITFLWIASIFGLFPTLAIVFKNYVHEYDKEEWIEPVVTVGLILFVVYIFIGTQAWMGWVEENSYKWTEVLIFVYGISFRLIDGFFVFYRQYEYSIREHNFLVNHASFATAWLGILVISQPGWELLSIEAVFTVVWLFLSFLAYYNMLGFISSSTGGENLPSSLILFYVISAFYSTSVFIDPSEFSTQTLLLFSLSYPIGILLGGAKRIVKQIV